MKIIFHRDFHKRYEKMRPSEQKRTDERIRIFQQNRSHPILNNHTLSYPYEGCRSINITGDLRAVFREIAPDVIRFIIAGTHAELYE
ncbi:MAG: hypothetical protein A3J10_04250 [Candidatus Sungbacteria bacterium RIFCSPLOWO2_02_FULL_54_10]|uniref:Plasmid stabilization protein n=2 Tax=Candidatus Sungiibacteriota TaxID=1817917 RepID=A0A1G2L7N5_9BACT|nr:MAG: hypothetical protein A3C92_00130 [Candidatus Sungbacteria bacterium RIFCSPHIGHO2_02_FULL_53_17]OHA06821.1 MAG: hypothetical protein A3B34_02635 [Candidatus Sungbacteria bacterium RIFCSPLOWO2_01_FULL_54_21]OHA13081.1 MAG: hypothetical protein A3J10_04250 [Candidatus Sungbacteria bacterium RIFCSPLOWO2_02_FULL_54_10]